MRSWWCGVNGKACVCVCRGGANGAGSVGTGLCVSGGLSREKKGEECPVQGRGQPKPIENG